MISLYLLVTLLYLYVPIKESIHMFQQNRYQIGRYHTWLKEQKEVKKVTIIRRVLCLLPLLLLMIVPEDGHPYELLMFLLSVYAYLFYRKDVQTKYIQKLSYTHRAKRLFILHILLHCLFFSILYTYLPFWLLLLILPFAYFLPWVMLYISALLSEPLECKIKKSYVKDAEAILARRSDLIRIGITGSYGKTSVKNILWALLSEEYYTYMTPHSYNNLMGLTISIRTQLKDLHQVFIAEMGADHVGEIERLATFVHPSIAIVTAVGPQHLSTFGTQENILKEKMRLVENLPFHGKAILNYDNPYIRSYHIENTCDVITYGIYQNDVDVRATDIHYSSSGSQFRIILAQEQFIVETVLLGEHNVLNILAAVATAYALHIKTDNIIKALKRLRYVEHRLEVREMGLYTLLDDAYNSNPAGAGYALDVLAQMSGQRFLLTPGFLDLGDMKKEAHDTYAKKMITCADTIILIGQAQTRDIYDTLIKEQFPVDHLYMTSSTKEAFALLHRMVKKGDTALIENDLPDAFNH